MKVSHRLPKYIEAYIENPEPGVPKREWRSSKIEKLFKKNSSGNWELALEDPEFKEAHKNYYRRETTSQNDGVIFEVACQAVGGALQLKDAVDQNRVKKISRGNIDFYVIPSLSSTETYGYERLHSTSANKAIDNATHEVMAGGLQLLDAGMGMGMSSSSRGPLELEDAPASAFAMGSSGTTAEEFEEPSTEVRNSIAEIACSVSLDCKEKHAPHEHIYKNRKFSELEIQSSKNVLIFISKVLFV